jgi:hypothetical protein
MWRFIVLTGVLMGLPAVAYCDTIQFAVDPANIGTVYQGGTIDLSSSGLNGTVLSGQSLSLDLVLSNNVLAKLFVPDPSALGVELIVDTNAGTYPGFAGTTTGYLLNSGGGQMGSSQVAGRDDASDGSFAMGLVSFTAGDFGGVEMADISGAEFDTTLPGSGFVITGAQLQFNLNSSENSLEFGTAQALPEQSSTVLLILVDVLALAAALGWGVVKLRRPV